MLRKCYLEHSRTGTFGTLSRVQSPVAQVMSTFSTRIMGPVWDKVFIFSEQSMLGVTDTKICPGLRASKSYNLGIWSQPSYPSGNGFSTSF